jgi:hypothetical protein
VNQKTSARQGNANTVLYKLAAKESYSSCNGSTASALPASSCIFNDVTIGSNAVPGEAGYGTSSAKYQATTGYDQATGLGSVNVTNLVNGWNGSTGATPPPSVTHYGILNKQNGMAVDVSGASLSSGAPLVVWAWNKSQDEQWQLISLSGGYYEIQNRLSGDVITDTGNSTAANNAITQSPWSNLPSQQWQLVPVDSQNYRIVNRLSGLDLIDYYAGATNGTKIVQYYWDGLADGQWQLVTVQ